MYNLNFILFSSSLKRKNINEKKDAEIPGA